MRLNPGTRLGPYEIRSTLGAGGMGEVYKAFDARLGRFVAIKTLLAGNLANPEQRRRFEREARTASALNHGGIVTVYDIGLQDGIDYIAMEFVEGKTLGAMLPHKGFPLHDVLGYSAQAADAISKAHEADILHRDLKPNNVMITTDGRVKVLDFGLSKLLQATSDSDDSSTGSLIDDTEPGKIIGTAAYMSPEQAQGKTLDARSDIFSFGSVLYEMATGQRAFRGENSISTILCILNEEPKSVRDLRNDAPPELERLIRRCLKKDPARRFQSMSDLKVALEELKEESESGRTSAVSAKFLSKHRFPFAWVAAGACLAGLTVMSALYFTQRKPAAPISSPVPMTTYPGTERQPDFSPDGTQVAFVWNGEKQDNWDIYLKVAGSTATPLRLTSDPGNDSNPKWSPDGKSIAFIRSSENTDAVFLTSALGGTERELAEFPTAIDTGVNWSPDGKWLAVTAGVRGGITCLKLVSVETGASRTITNPPAGTGGDFDPAFSPDGRSLAFVRQRGLNLEEIWVAALTKDYSIADEPRKLVADGNKNSGPAWTPDGREILYSSGESALASMYRVRAAGGAAPERIDALGTGVTEPALSRSSAQLAFSRKFRSSAIWRLDLQAKHAEPEQLISSSYFRDVFPQYSPDGSRIAFFSNRTGVNQIWTSNADGKNAIQVTSMSGTTTGTPRWSPDGKRIAFDSNAGGKWQIYVVNAMGGTPRAVTEGDSTNVVASWSRDGKWLYFNSKRTGREEVWKTPSDGNFQPVQVTHNGANSSTESFDGKFLYFTKMTPRYEFSLWRLDFASGEELELIPSLHRYNFAVTEKAIYYATTSELRVLDLETKKSALLYKLDKHVDLGVSIYPDRRYLLFSELEANGSDLMLVRNFH